jgi:hypothetical protein
MTSGEFRRALKTLGLTYHTAAEELGMGKWGFQTIGKWARGEKPVPTSIAERIELRLLKHEATQ